jgi:hypothetical protein
MAQLDLKLVDENYQPEAGDKQAATKTAIAAAIREGRRRERSESATQIARAHEQSAIALQATKQAHTEELERHDARWAREEAKHGGARFWSGMFTGAMCAGAIAAIGLALFTNAIISPTFDAASRSQFNTMAVEAITQERPPTTNEPRSESAP